MQVNKQLPIGWVECYLGDILFLKNGFAFKSSEYIDEGIPIIRISDINDSLVSTIRSKRILEDNEYDDYIVETGDILIAMSGATTGKFGLFKAKEKAYQNQRVGNLKLHSPQAINKNFVYYLMWSLKREIEKEAYGGAQPNISGKKIEALQIKLPPLHEQQRIVAKIEELFSDLDDGIASLKKAQAQLKIYRQAVLKKAFVGDLTKEWRAKQKSLPMADNLLEQIKLEREICYAKQLEKWKQKVEEWKMNEKKGKRPTRISKLKELPKLSDEEIELYGNLPEIWKWTRFCNITYKIGDIDHKMPKTCPGGLPYLSTGNLRENGTIDFDNAKTISKDDFERLALKIKPNRGDIIFPRYGTIGRNILVDFDKKFLVSYSCAIIKSIKSVMNEKFVYYFSISPVIKKEIKRYSVQTTQANIGIASIENFVFPLCSREEQQQIVAEIESRLSICDKLEQTIEESLQKSEALRQSILKKAFEGKLVPQDPKDEPAEKLLERIQASR